MADAKLDYKTTILERKYYTELVYGRINKKLNLNLSKAEIEKMIFEMIQKTDDSFFQKIGKNIYITNEKKNAVLTINSYTYRIITADRIKK